MSKRHPIDEFFSQRLANSSASVPDDMWNRIAKQRQKPDPYKKIIGWTTLGMLVTGMLIFAWFSFGSPPTLGNFPVDTTTTETITTKGVAASPNQSEIDPQVVSSTINHQASETQQQVQHPLTATASLPNNSSVQTVSNTTIASSQEMTALPRTSSSESNIAQAVNTSTAALPTNEQPSTETTELLTSDIVDIADNDKLNEEESAINRIAGPHQRVNMGKVAQLPNRLFQLNDEPNIKLFANHAPRCADFANPFFHLDAEFLAGPAYASQMLMAKTNESIPHLQQRKDSETSSLSSTTGIRLAATSNTGLGLRSGLSYTQINEKFTHHVGSKIEISVEFDPNGQVIRRDTIYTEAYDEEYTNRLKFVEIPLLLGYEQKVGKFRIGVNAGAYLNLVFDAKGTVLSPATEEPIPFGQEGDLNKLPIFERSATAAWYGGLSFAYNLHSRYSLLAEPYFKTYPRALSSNGYDLSQNYWMTGLQLGLRMRL